MILPEPAESSVRLMASSTVNYAVILTLLAGYGYGAWFLASQTATNAAIAERQSRFEASVAMRIDTVEKRDEARVAAVSSIDNRLTRIEAQLTYLVTNGAKR